MNIGRIKPKKKWNVQKLEQWRVQLELGYFERSIQLKGAATVDQLIQQKRLEDELFNN